VPENRHVEEMNNSILWRTIRNKIKSTVNLLKIVNYEAENVSSQEFYDYITGETFSEDTTTLDDILGNEYLMIHELTEISELKKYRRKINKRVIVESPKEIVYEAHFKAMETELTYALHKKDYFWIKARLKQHTESVLQGDLNLPEEMRKKAESLFEEFSKSIKP